MLVLLDVKSAFDGLPHAVIEACLDRLGLSGCLRSFISAFLTGRTFRVRVGQELSNPRDITTGVPQGSVLSPFLFNMALAGLPASLPADPRFPVRCSIYADDVALWTRGPRKSMPFIWCSLQRALDAVTAFLGSIGLTVSTAKTDAMLIHPLASARRYTKQLKITGRALPWQQMGLSFLEMKNHVMLSYLLDLTHIIWCKVSGKSIDGDPSIRRLVQARTVCITASTILLFWAV
ncbi:hypothetical protein HPB49_001805 [Dermacentor silvarum]|uniref:Uncharacterized protein n=1 Tax=Dermacentor silvarum TaxID=543639 RepID=A0ACB8DSP3_DERSI|nr:hypothetical protein HPB49_001805 [Dermacentor silvarum]